MDKHLVKFRKGKGSRTLGALCEVYGVVNEAAHDAQGDAVAAGLLLKAYAEAFPEIADAPIDELYAAQGRWHKSWAGEFSDYLQRNGKDGFSDEEFEWPIQVVPSDTLF
jgi:DNA polymerase-3 subunit epsilon